MLNPTLPPCKSSFHQNLIVGLSLSYATIYKELPLVSHILRLSRQIQNIRCHLDTKSELVESFYNTRKSQEYQAVFDKTNPLVSVCIATYNRANLLTERAIKPMPTLKFLSLAIIAPMTLLAVFPVLMTHA